MNSSVAQTPPRCPNCNTAMEWDDRLSLDGGRMAHCPKCDHLTPEWDVDAPTPATTAPSSQLSPRMEQFANQVIDEVEKAGIDDEHVTTAGEPPDEIIAFLRNEAEECTKSAMARRTQPGDRDQTEAELKAAKRLAEKMNRAKNGPSEHKAGG
jgi:hypothetical protein